MNFVHRQILKVVDNWSIIATAVATLQSAHGGSPVLQPFDGATHQRWPGADLEEPGG